MELIHNIGRKITVRKTAGGQASLMLAEGCSYLWIGQAPASRYQGWFLGYDNNKLAKIVDDIRAVGGGEICALENNFCSVKRVHQELSESFWFLDGACLAYEANKPAQIEIFLDIKDPYKNPELERHYETWQENNVFITSYRQDEKSQVAEVFVAVCGDIAHAKIENEWVRRDYEFDRKRQSPPWQRWVFKPAVFKASKLVVAAGFTKEDAVIAAMKSWLDFEKIKKTKQKEQNNVRIAKKAGAPRLLANKAAAVEMDAVKLSARNALQMLYGRKGLAPGLRAGLPWFFQFWQRDEAVSFGGLARFDRKYIFEIFWRQIGELGRNNFRFQTADGESWLFLRAAQMIKKRVFSFKETARIRDCLERSIENLLEKNTQKCFAINDVGQTWMDSLGRGGACIEVQALRLAMYSLAADLATNGEKIDCCLTLEKELADAVRERMFDGRRLADAFDPVTNEADFTARPNIFLAAYIYPQLLRKQEWIKCFEYALDRLWLNWGGLASLDRGDPRFCAKDAGEDPASYHNGDSWFWVNNIAAIAMARLGRKRFKSYIGKILEASVNDILWNGAIGCASEISSAASYEPAGCVNQAWSNATFLELCRELKI